ncbi:NAD(P)-dependent alcohol dehydrogenase [Arcticibacterium luteifluviistationis]|uniref:Alcohol dehydrogenase n=1 Tax=Arcticibacterium luteifluviistationis TaxID=1784714 RepID=A0A2Z4GCI2_9BACT|nr:NAD(P)-dependent alcohol dehydrogenase [Arcticibacterium luteifluviistationis]AWV98999.1 alcohol dehydrogenase [Arcticibacterium luteifluviistationis]
MKALVFNKYGNPEEVLHVKEIDKPKPKKNEVLVKVKSTSINDYDWSMVRGRPKLYQLMFGLFKPKRTIPGMELSGIIEAVGENISHFNIGDEVYGDISEYGFGTFAEYIAIDAKAVIKKPANLSFEQAAALPHAGLLGYQALKEIKEHQKILINGAGGGVGSIAIQIAKHYKCEVTGVDTSAKFIMMKTQGFDHVIDYQQTDFTKTGVKYDFILDCKSKKSVFAYLKALKPNGTYVTVGGDLTNLIGLLFWGKPLSLFSKKKLQILALKPNEGLEDLNKLFNIKCQIDGPYQPEEIPRLIQYFGEGKHKGKVVVNF